MFAVVQNGNIVQLIQPDVAFVIGEKQYSARFIRNATEAERKSVGVYEVIQGTQQDQRFYWVTGPSYRVNETNQTLARDLRGYSVYFVGGTNAGKLKTIASNTIGIALFGGHGSAETDAFAKKSQSQRFGEL